MQFSTDIDRHLNWKLYSDDFVVEIREIKAFFFGMNRNSSETNRTKVVDLKKPSQASSES